MHSSWIYKKRKEESTSRYSMLLLCLLLICYSCNHKGDNKQNRKAENMVTDHTQSETIQITDLTNQIKEDPDNAELYYQRSELYIGYNNIQNGVEDLKKAIRLNSQEGKYYFSLAGIYYLSQEYGEAFRLYSKSYEYQPDDIQTNLKLAWLAVIMEKYQNTFLHANNVLKQDVHNAIAYFYKGLAYKESGDTARAISNFQTAIEQEPEYYDPYMQIGLLMTAKRNILGISYFQNAIRLDSFSAEAWYGLGMFYQSMKEWRSAINTYKSLIILQPQYEQAYYNIGYIYYNQNTIDTAYSNFDMAIKVNPTYAKAYFMRGSCSEIEGRLQQALADYKQASIFSMIAAPFGNHNGKPMPTSSSNINSSNSFPSLR